MKVMRRLLSLGLSTLMLAGMLVAGTSCAKKEDKVLRVGMECQYAPYNWTQDDDKNGAVKIKDSDKYANGFDVQMAKKIAESMGYELEIVKTEWDGLIPAVQTGKIDAVIAGMSITSDRLTAVDFSDPYYYADIVVLTMNDSKYASAKSLSDLNGAKVSSQLSTVWYTVLDQIPGATVDTAIDTVPTLLVSLTSGKLDAVTVDLPTAMAAVYSNSKIKMIKFEGSNGFTVSEEDTNLGIAVKKNNPTVLDGINKALAGISDADRAKLMEDAIANQPLA
jgi:putative lysine transport system substrate-binding protein